MSINPRVMVDASPGGNAQPAGMGSAMLPMLFLLLMMMSLMMFPGIRNSLSDGAGSVIEPFLFGTLGIEQFFLFLKSKVQIGYIED